MLAPFGARASDSFRAGVRRAGRRSTPRTRRSGAGMIRVICPHCGTPSLRITPVDDGQEVVCPRCLRRFLPEEEEWVDSEDEL